MRVHLTTMWRVTLLSITSFLVVLLLAPLSTYASTTTSPISSHLRSFIKSRTDDVAISIYDVKNGITWTFNNGSVQRTASVVKLDILAALLYKAQVTSTPLTESEEETAALMIEQSDNDSATDLYNEVGAAPGLSAFNKKIPLSKTTPNIDWGFTTTSASDQVILMKLFAQPNKILNNHSRSYGLSLLDNVASYESWGIGSVKGENGAVVALKNGWYPTTYSSWQINSVGWVRNSATNYVICVLTKGNSSENYGITTINDISHIVFNTLK